MANSRMHLCCRHCGAVHPIAKGYYGEYGTRALEPEKAIAFVKMLEEFFDKHAKGLCCDESSDEYGYCTDNARDHFIILEEGETYNPSTRTIENVYLGHVYPNETIKLPDNF